MPVYEYEPKDDRTCFLCEGKVAVIQGVNEPALELCPWCGLDVRRVISQATFKLARDLAPEGAGRKGLTTFKRVEKGVWEKLGGEGADYLIGSAEDVAAVEAEKKPKPPTLDLDAK